MRVADRRCSKTENPILCLAQQLQRVLRHDPYQIMHPSSRYCSDLSVTTFSMKPGLSILHIDEEAFVKSDQREFHTVAVRHR